MDRIDPGFQRNVDDPLAIEIGRDRPRTSTKMIGLVRLEAVERQFVLLRIDRNRLNAQFGRGPEYADRDLRTIGYKDAFDFADPHRAILS